MSEPVLDRSLDPAQCLAPTEVIDCDNTAVRTLAHRVAGDGPVVQQAVRLFDYVRDEIEYEFRAKLTLQAYQASRILEEAKGFCVQKAILLCALLRAVRIPSALVLCDLKDYTLPTRIVEAMGADTMFHHGLTAIHLRERWLLADASLSPDVVERRGYRRVDFNGAEDALFPKLTVNGSQHATVTRFHGMYPDLPFLQMLAAFATAYAQANLPALAKMGYQL